MYQLLDKPFSIKGGVMFFFINLWIFPAAAAAGTSFTLIQAGKQVLDTGEIWCSSAPLTAN